MFWQWIRLAWVLWQSSHNMLVQSNRMLLFIQCVLSSSSALFTFTHPRGDGSTAHRERERERGNIKQVVATRTFYYFLSSGFLVGRNDLSRIMYAWYACVKFPDKYLWFVVSNNTVRWCLTTCQDISINKCRKSLTCIVYNLRSRLSPLLYWFHHWVCLPCHRQFLVSILLPFS